MRATPWDLAGRAALSVSAALWRDPRVGASVLGLPWVHLALVCGPRECALGLVKLVRLRLQAADACAAVPRSVSGLLPGGRICALGLRSLPEKVSSGLAETRRRCASVFGWVEVLPVLLLTAVVRGATRFRRVRGTEKKVHCRTSLYCGVRIEETVERAEIAGMGSD